MKDDDFKLLRGFDYEQTDEQTFVIVESLTRLKIFQLIVWKLMLTPANITGLAEEMKS